MCVGLPEGVHLRVEMLVMCDGHRDEGEEGVASRRSSMHVQSHSEWAPANIGPYSQACTVSTSVSLADGMYVCIGLHLTWDQSDNFRSGLNTGVVDISGVQIGLSLLWNLRNRSSKKFYLYVV